MSREYLGSLLNSRHFSPVFVTTIVGEEPGYSFWLWDNRVGWGETLDDILDVLIEEECTNYILFNVGEVEDGQLD